jgi:hypothetical protein
MIILCGIERFLPDVSKRAENHGVVPHLLKKPVLPVAPG